MLKLDSTKEVEICKRQIREMKQIENNRMKDVIEAQRIRVDLEMQVRDIEDKKICHHVNIDKLNEIFNNADLQKNYGLFWSYNLETRKYVALDNEEGIGWSADFDRLDDCINWLLGDDDE